MPDRMEHFIHGPAAGLAALCAALPPGVTARAVAGGVILTTPLERRREEATIAQVELLAKEHGLVHDGWGRALDEPEADARLDLQTQSFASRAGIAPGHGFALPLGDGRVGHAVFLGEDTQGYLLLAISTLVTEGPTSAADLAQAPMRYRQPILFWRTGFAVHPLAGATEPLIALPNAVAFRMGIGWPGPETIERLGQEFGIGEPETEQGWSQLLLAMAEAGRRLPEIDQHSIWTAQVGRSGTLKLIEDYTPVSLQDRSRAPMPWAPATISEATTALLGGPDMIAARDIVT